MYDRLIVPLFFVVMIIFFSLGIDLPYASLFPTLFILVFVFALLKIITEEGLLKVI